jgi:Ca2+-binding RTX toxin-like protein
VAPWSSGNSPVGNDWFEVTNSGTTAIDLTGWKMDDSSGSFASAVALSGITSIAAGESVIFIETDNLASARTAFLNTWFGANPPANLQIGSYKGSGVGLSTGGDRVNLFDSSGVLQASVAFGASPAGPFPTFDNSAGAANTTITTTSTVGVHGAFAAANDAAEIGSPGTIGLVNDPPTITSPAAASVAENTAVTTIVYDADATDPDSTGLLFSLTGDDAARFSIDANSGEVRFLASPDFETPHDAGGNNVYDLVVHANDGVNDTAKAVAITVTNVAGETWVGGNQDESRTGTGEEDNLGGGGGNDTLIGAGGNDILDGGTGVNTASYTGTSKNFEVRISAEQEVITIRDRLGTEGQDTASHVQFLNFADQTIDATTLVDAANLDPSAFVPLIDLYNAYLGRAPDALGLDYWASQLSEGMTLNDIARSFFASDEATDARPPGDSFTAQVTSAYNDILHRAPDAGGLAYWVAELESGRMAPEKLPLAFVMGAHAAGGADAQTLASLENIGAYYAIEQGLSNVDHARTVLGAEVIDVEAARGQIDDYADAAADPATAELVVKLVGVIADDIVPLA